MNKFIILVLFVFTFEALTAQQKDTTNVSKASVMKDSVVAKINKIGDKTQFSSLIFPAALIAYGITTIVNHGLYSIVRAEQDLQHALGNKGDPKLGKNQGPLDNYLVASPYVEFGLLLLLKQKCKNDALNTALLILKSEVIMELIVLPLKYLAHEQRPDGSDHYSFPSGHTAEAFCAATIVYREYRYKSPWYGIGAYALATTVGAFRMINNKHWESDVLVGAGIGMLSVNLVYATHLNKWGRKDYCISPMFDCKNKGFAMSLKF